MNRVEFLTELAILLQEIPEEERTEAMQYYNDYFDDAGYAEEENIIKELGSPQKVAKEVMEGLDKHEEQPNEYSVVRLNSGGSYHYAEEPKSTGMKNQNRKVGKIILIIIAAIILIPIVVPVVAGLAVAAIGILIAIVAIFASVVIVSASIAVAGVALFVGGLITLIVHFTSGLVLTGCGMIAAVLGTIATVASVKLCMIVFPAMINGIIWLCRKPFEYRKAAI